MHQGANSLTAECRTCVLCQHPPADEAHNRGLWGADGRALFPHGGTRAAKVWAERLAGAARAEAGMRVRPARTRGCAPCRQRVWRPWEQPTLVMSAAGMPPRVDSSAGMTGPVRAVTGRLLIALLDP